jgi:pteridine reductase
MTSAELGYTALFKYHTQAMTSKTALITGAARRIGAVIASYLHQQGMDIIVHFNTSETDAIHLTEKLNSIRTNSAIIAKADLRDTNSYKTLIDTAVQFKSRLDVLVNNASLFFPTTMGETTPQQWTELTTTNLMAPYFLAQESMSHLRKTHGCIINVSDIHGEKPLKNHPVYSATKAGLVMLTRTMALELGPDVRVNGVAPGAILWPEQISEDQKKQIVSKTLLQRPGVPEDIAAAVYFLIENGTYITGQILTVDGGRLN